jgi:hypothetical protein
MNFTVFKILTIVILSSKILVCMDAATSRGVDYEGDDASSVDMTPPLASQKAPGELPLEDPVSVRDEKALTVLRKIRTNNPRVTLGELEHKGMVSPTTVITLREWFATLSQALKGRGGGEGEE